MHASAVPRRRIRQGVDPCRLELVACLSLVLAAFSSLSTVYLSLLVYQPGKYRVTRPGTLSGA